MKLILLFFGCIIGLFLVFQSQAFAQHVVLVDNGVVGINADDTVLRFVSEGSSKPLEQIPEYLNLKKTLLADQTKTAVHNIIDASQTAIRYRETKEVLVVVGAQFT